MIFLFDKADKKLPLTNPLLQHVAKKEWDKKDKIIVDAMMRQFWFSSNGVGRRWWTKFNEYMISAEKILLGPIIEVKQWKTKTTRTQFHGLATEPTRMRTPV